MAALSGDVAGYVREVTLAFEKALSLVRRVEDRKDSRDDLEAVRDLYKSLTLGPTIVQGYFDADSKRLGQAYTIGDYEAQVQLRDVLLSLKTLVGDLSDVLLDDKDVDFRQLQDAFDNCRVNAGVCLGQLSQRLADPMRMHYNNSSPQYLNAIPSGLMSSPSLHYSSSQSTHSSRGNRYPQTPDPYYQLQSLSPQWSAKRSEPDDNYYTNPRRRDTETSIQESYRNWPGTNQTFSERDPDELSVRRPSSHTLAPEDGALLSPGLPKDMTQRQQSLASQQDGNRDSFASYSVNSDSQSPAKQSGTSSPQGRERYGPDDFSPIHQQGPFGPDRDSTQSVTSFASRASDANHSTLEHVPQPLRLAHRPAPQPTRQSSGDSQQSTSRKPLPAAHYDQFTGHPAINKHNEIPIRVPQSDSQRVAIPPRSESRLGSFGAAGIPPRSESRPNPAYAITPQRMLSPPPPGPPFQPSASVQRAMQSNQVRRQYNIDRSPQSTPQPLNQSQMQYTPPMGQHPSQNAGIAPLQAPYPVAPHEYPQSPPPQILLQQSYPPNQQNMIFQSPQQAQPPSTHLMSQSTRPPMSPPPQSPPLQQQNSSQLSPQSSRPSTQSSIQSPPRSQPTSARAPSFGNIPLPSNLPLALPTEKNTHPFCKGAFRLFIGLNKKAFVAANRPVGMTSYIPYWRCDKCLFEGVMANKAGPADKKGRPGKPEKVFDQTIHECGPMSTAIIGPDGRGEGSGGVRYKWAFLAKCHVPLKTVPEALTGKQMGTFGSYGCIFCMAEGTARGWTGPNSSLSFGTASDAASTFSGKSGNSIGSNSAGTPVFGNLQLFMDHLQMHRREQGWPCQEMQMRMKCVVGRAADRQEDWEINFLPV